MSTALIDEKGAGIKGGYPGSMLLLEGLGNFFGALRRAFPRRKVFAPAGSLVLGLVGW